MQAVVGIHKDRKLPPFHRETFSAWFDQRRAPATPRPRARVALFATCSVEFNDPATGKAAVAVLERTASTCRCPASAAAACRTSTAAR